MNQAVHVAAESPAACRTHTRRLIRQCAGGTRGSVHALQNRGSGHISLSWIGAQRWDAVGKGGARGKQVRQAVCPGQEPYEKRIGRRNDGEVVDGAKVFADAVNPIAAANRRGVMPGNVVGKTNTRLPDGRVLVVEAGGIQRSGDSGEAELTDALRVEIRLPGRDRQGGIGVAGVAKRVVGRAQKFISETEVKSERLAGAVIVLREPSVAGNSVIVIPEPATALAEKRRTRQKALEVRAICGRTRDEKY